MISGVYALRCSVNKTYYIGSSINIKKRKATHYRQLRNNKHYNNYLQRTFNKYGEKNIKFTILKECSKGKRLIIEQKYLDKYIGNKKCMNVFPDAVGALGYTHTNKTKIKLSLASKGRKHTDKAIRKMSAANIGRVFSSESLEKMSISAKNRKPITDETRRRISIAAKNRIRRILTDEHKKNLSIMQKKAWANRRKACD